MPGSPNPSIYGNPASYGTDYNQTDWSSYYNQPPSYYDPNPNRQPVPATYSDGTPKNSSGRGPAPPPPPPLQQQQYDPLAGLGFNINDLYASLNAPYTPPVYTPPPKAPPRAPLDISPLTSAFTQLLGGMGGLGAGFGQQGTGQTQYNDSYNKYADEQKTIAKLRGII